MSDAESQGQPQDRIGHLLKRMTLANLGLDDLAGIDEGSRAAMAGADDFAAQIDANAQRMESGLGLSVLAGTPDFLQGVQERYVPLHVDTEFGLDVDTSGPRRPGDVGPWQKLIDGVHLILFDEDEEGDFVAFDPSIRKHQVRQAVARMARERRAPVSAPALDPVRKQLQLAQAVVDQPNARRRPSDFMSISESARRSLFGTPDRSASALVHRLGEGLLDTDGETPVEGADEFGPGEQLVQGARARSMGSLPGMATVEAANFGSAIARRHGASDGIQRRASLLSGPGDMLSSLRGLHLTDEDSVAALVEGRRQVDPRLGTASSLGQAAGQTRDGYQYLGASPGSLLALVPESLEGEAIAALHGARASEPGPVRSVGSSATEESSFISAYPSSMGRAGMLDARSYQLEVSFARLTAAMSGAKRPTLSARERRDAAQRASSSVSAVRAPAAAELRERLTGYAALSGRSGQLLQSLADEPVARLAAVARSRMEMPGIPAAAQRADRSGRAMDLAGPGVADWLVHRKPAAPSTLGFTVNDLIAPIGIERVASAAGRLTDVRELYLSTSPTELVTQVGDDIDAGPASMRPAAMAANQKSEALVRRALAERGLMTSTERASLSARVEARSNLLMTPPSSETLAREFAGSRRTSGTPDLTTAADHAGDVSRTSPGLSSIYGDVSLDRRFLPTLTSSLDVARQTGVLKVLRSGVEEESSSGAEATYSRLDRMLGLVGVGQREAAELRGALDVLKRVGAVPRESKLAWQGETPVLITPKGDVLDARTALESVQRPAQLESLAQNRAISSPRQVVAAPIDTRGESSPRMDRFGDISRMLGSRRALTLLASDVLETADPIAVDMLRESVLGEVARITSRPADMVGQDRVPESGLSSPAASHTDSILKRVGLGQQGELRLPTGIDSTAEVVRLALSGQSAETSRSGLSMRRGIGRSHQPAAEVSDSLSAGFEARSALGEGAAGILARLDVEEARPDVGAKPFEPGVVGLAQHEERVNAEVESYVQGFTGLLGDVTEMRPIQVTNEDGESLRLSLSPRALARVLQGRGGMAEVRGQTAVPVQELRTTLRDVLRQRGATPASVAQALQDRISGLSLAPGEMAEDRTTVGQVAETARAIERAAGRFASAKASVERRRGFFETLAPGAFDSAAPSYDLASAFDSPLQTVVEQRARRVLGSRIQSLAADRAEKVAAEMGLAVGTRDIDEETLGIDVSAEGDGLAARALSTGRRLDVTIESTLPSGVGGYEMIQPASLSRVLKRFAPERRAGMSASSVQEIVDASLAETVVARATSPRAVSQSRFDSLQGEPGQLSDTLERFVPASSAPRPVGRGGERTMAGDHVLPSAITRDPGSLSHRIELLEMEGSDGLLGEVRREVLDRMSARSEPRGYVEPTGMSEDAVRELFDLGSGGTAKRQGRRHEVARMLDRLDGLLDDAQSVSERQGRVGAPGVLAALKGMDSGLSLESGLPSWRKKNEQIQGIDANELKDLLRQVGATPVQGSKPAIDRQLVNPYVGQPGAEGADPLFAGGAAAAEAKPSNQVQDQEAAFSAADVGLPPYEELMFIAEEAYRVIVKKLHEEFKKRSE